MTPEQFSAAGEAIYGARWLLPLSRALGVNTRTVQRWASGQNAVPEPVAADLRDLLRIAGHDPAGGG
jgi:hypothetical protein